MATALLLAASAAWGDQSANGAAAVPYYPRSTTSNQSLGAVNRNFADITGRNRDRLVKTVGDQDCAPNGGALVGATQKGGYVFGGTCTPVAAIGAAVSFSTVTATGAVEFANVTMAVLQQTTPSKKGQTFFCTTCTPPKIVTSTGTAKANYADAIGGEFK